jgi:acetolactate synthase-1/2/3 large subunit
MLDAALRYQLPLPCIVSLNGGPEGTKPGRYLGYTGYDIMAQTLGCDGEYVERPEDVRPALGRAQSKVDAGIAALVNFEAYYRARATTVHFSNYMT